MGSRGLLIISDTIDLVEISFFIILVILVTEAALHFVHGLLVLNCNFRATRSIKVRITLLSIILIESGLVTALVNRLMAKTIICLRIRMTSWLILEGLKIARLRIKLKLRRVI